MRFWKDLWKDENGAVATEYVILVGLLAIVLIGSIVAFRQQIAMFMGGIMDKLSGSSLDATDETSSTPAKPR